MNEKLFKSVRPDEITLDELHKKINKSRAEIIKGIELLEPLREGYEGGKTAPLLSPEELQKRVVILFEMILALYNVNNFIDIRDLKLFNVLYTVLDPDNPILSTGTAND